MCEKCTLKDQQIEKQKRTIETLTVLNAKKNETITLQREVIEQLKEAKLLAEEKARLKHEVLDLIEEKFNCKVPESIRKSNNPAMA